jgi:metal-sulfur cluster biosynthetic enzyme
MREASARRQEQSLERRVDEALDGVVDPCSIATGAPITLGEMGLVQSVHIDGEDVRVVLRLTSPLCLQAGNILQAVETRLRAATNGIVTCTIDPASDWMPQMMSNAARQRLRRLRPVP